MRLLFRLMLVLVPLLLLPGLFWIGSNTRVTGPPPTPSYPSDRWERLWYIYSGNVDSPWGQYLGSGPDESNLNFDNNYGSGSLAYGRSMQIGFVSTRTVKIANGTWISTVGGDDGLRMYIDDQPVIDAWRDSAYIAYNYTTTYSSAGDHKVRLEYYQNGGKARVSFVMELQAGAGAYVVQGYVFALDGGAPVPGCWVSVYDPTTGKSIGSWTDDRGYYDFSTAGGMFVFAVSPPPALHYEHYQESSFVVSSNFFKGVTLAYPKTQVGLGVDRTYLFSGMSFAVDGNVKLTNGTLWRHGQVRIYFDGSPSSAPVKEDGSFDSLIQLPITMPFGWHTVKVEFVPDEPWLEGSRATTQVFIINVPIVILVAIATAGVFSLIPYAVMRKRRSGPISPTPPTELVTSQASSVEGMQETANTQASTPPRISQLDDLDLLRSIKVTSSKIILESEKLEAAQTQISKRRRPSSSALIGYCFAGIGGLSLVLSVVFTSTVGAFVGLGLAFWGALLLFIRPRHYVRSDLMDSTALSSLASIDRVITNLGYTQKGVYVPVGNPEKAVIFIPSQPLNKIPKPAQLEKQTFVKDPDGIIMVPPGLALANLFERELGVKFSEWSLREMVERLPKLLIEDLEMVQDCTIKVDGDHVSFRFVESVYSEFCSKLRSSTNVCASLGCPMCSAMACILAQVSHRPVEFDKDKYATDKGTVESSYILLPG